MTDDFEPTPSPRRRPRAGLRFLIAFLAGIIAVLGVGVGALYAYDRQYDGRILPGVRIGALDLSGLDPTTARFRLDEHFGHVARGRIVVSSPKGDLTLGYRELGRAPDIDTMLGHALAAGRESGM